MKYLSIFFLLTILFIGCEDEISNITENQTNNIAITQSNNKVVIAITANKMEASDEIYSLNFTKDTVKVNYTVTDCGDGAVTLIFKNATEQNIYTFNHNVVAANLQFLFAPDSMRLIVDQDFSGIISFTGDAN